MLKSYRFWLGILISVVCLYLSLKDIRFDELWRAMTQINLLWVIPGYLFFFISYFGRVFRWQLLFTPLRIRWGEVFATLSIGYLLSTVLPARLGDFARAYLLAMHEKVATGRSLSTVVIERVSDGLSVVLFLVLLLPIIPNIPVEARTAAFFAALVGGAVLVVLFGLSWQRERALPFLRRVTARVSFLQREGLWHTLESLVDGLSILRTPRPLLGVALWSFEIWFFAAVLNWVGMLAMGLPLGLDAAALVMVITSLVVIVPSSPGYIGVFHFVTQQTLAQVYGLDPARALAYAVVIHAFINISLVVIGALFAWREGVNLSQLESASASAQ